MRAFASVTLTLCVALGLVHCKSSYKEPESSPSPEQGAAAEVSPASQASANAAPRASAEPVAAQVATAVAPTASQEAPTGGDPLGGKFSLADATAGLKGKGKLFADIVTSLGKLSCELYDDKAPNTVANFIGLARGLRPWKSPEGAWVKRPLYEGTVFHRIIKGFMIQGGDPQGTGAGEPGYVIPDEVWPGAAHNRRGLLCMANRGANTNGAQFFITDGSAPHLDRGYTIFGSCGPDSLIDTLASVPIVGERPQTPPKILKVTIQRK